MTGQQTMHNNQCPFRDQIRCYSTDPRTCKYCGDKPMALFDKVLGWIAIALTLIAAMVALGCSQEPQPILFSKTKDYEVYKIDHRTTTIHVFKITVDCQSYLVVSKPHAVAITPILPCQP